MLPYSCNQKASHPNCNSFVGREVWSIGGSFRGSPWKWLNTRATNRTCFRLACLKRECSDFFIFGFTGFLGCKKQKNIVSSWTWNSSWTSFLLASFKSQYKSLLSSALNFSYWALGLLSWVFCKFGPVKRSFSVDSIFSRKKCKWRRKNSI